MLAVNGETKEEHLFFEVFFLKRFSFGCFPEFGTFPRAIFGENFWRLCELVGPIFSPLKLQELETRPRNLPLNELVNRLENPDWMPFDG